MTKGYQGIQGTIGVALQLYCVNSLGTCVFLCLVYNNSDYKLISERSEASASTHSTHPLVAPRVFLRGAPFASRRPSRVSTRTQYLADPSAPQILTGVSAAQRLPPAYQSPTCTEWPLGRIPVGFSIVLADKAFGKANDAEILIIVTALTLALMVDIPGRPMCSNEGLSVFTFSGTAIVPLLVSRVTQVSGLFDHDYLFSVPSSLHHLKIRLWKDCKNTKGCLHSMIIIDVV
jgi:hypothetical protein